MSKNTAVIVEASSCLSMVCGSFGTFVYVGVGVGVGVGAGNASVHAVLLTVEH